MCFRFLKKNLKKKKLEKYSPSLSPILSINGIHISEFERDLYDNRDYERNPLMESLSGSLSPENKFPLIYQIGIYDSESDISSISCSSD